MLQKYDNLITMVILLYDIQPCRHTKEEREKIINYWHLVKRTQFYYQTRTAAI